MKEIGYDFDIPELTDAQIENWRELLVTLPLPPFNHPIGSYAWVMPRHDIEILVGRMQSYIDEQFEESKNIETESSNLIRTRPRDPNKPTRG